MLLGRALTSVLSSVWSFGMEQLKEAQKEQESVLAEATTLIEGSGRLRDR